MVARLLIPLGVAVTLLVAACGDSDKAEVPDVVGKNVNAAERTLEDADLEAFIAVKNVVEADKDCRVTRQQPDAGDEAAIGSEVRIRCEVQVPELTGMRPDPALAKLLDLGFDTAVKHKPSDLDYSRCRVKGQDKHGGAPPGTQVEIDLACKDPEPPEPPPEPTEETPPPDDCEAGYDPCVPPYPPDLDCGDLDGSYAVSGSDPHGLDADGDGSGCE